MLKRIVAPRPLTYQFLTTRPKTRFRTSFTYLSADSSPRLNLARPVVRLFVKTLMLLKIRIVDLRTGKFDTNRMKLAADSLVSLFGNSSKVALKKVTDTTAEGWQDVPGSVCRAHQYKRSLVLPVPYYENVE
jgi:hypothetical protein